MKRRFVCEIEGDSTRDSLTAYALFSHHYQQHDENDITKQQERLDEHWHHDNEHNVTLYHQKSGKRPTLQKVLQEKKRNTANLSLNLSFINSFFFSKKNPK